MRQDAEQVAAEEKAWDGGGGLGRPGGLWTFQSSRSEDAFENTADAEKRNTAPPNSCYR